MKLSIVLILTISLALLICLLFGLMFSYYFLLKRIARLFPKYYKRLGSPFLPSASRSITKTIERDKFNYRLIAKLLTGLPNDFPEEAKLRRLASYVRAELFIIIALIIIGIGVSIII